MGDERLLVANNSANDFDQLVGDVVKHQRLGLACGDFAFKITTKGDLVG